MIQLFFDDDGLFSRVNTVRKYGNPELIEDAVYYDGLCSTDYCTCDVFKTGDDKIHMIYSGKTLDGVMRCFMACSTDGIHFSPENVADKTNVENRVAPHELIALNNSEIAGVIEDKTADKCERYKMFVSSYNGESLSVPDDEHIF